MVSLLFMISFLLHIVLLMAVYRLFQQLQQVKHQNDEQLETLAETLLSEMKLVNQALDERPGKEQVQGKQHTYPEETAQTKLERTSFSSYGVKPAPATDRPTGGHSTEVPEKMAAERKDSFEPSAAGKALQLANQGYTVEDIARQLSRGKTEVELMLKMMQQKK